MDLVALNNKLFRLRRAQWLERNCKDLQNDRKVMKNADINIASIFFPLQLDSSVAQLVEPEYKGLSTT